MSFSFSFAGVCGWWGKEILLCGLVTDFGMTRYIYTLLEKGHSVEIQLWSRVATKNLLHTVYHHFELRFIRFLTVKRFEEIQRKQNLNLCWIWQRYIRKFEAKVVNENLHACISPEILVLSILRFRRVWQAVLASYFWPPYFSLILHFPIACGGLHLFLLNFSMYFDIQPQDSVRSSGNCFHKSQTGQQGQSVFNLRALRDAFANNLDPTAVTFHWDKV